MYFVGHESCAKGGILRVGSSLSSRYAGKRVGLNSGVGLQSLYE